MDSYVINLATRPERLAYIQETFGKAGIPFERFDAVDKDKAKTHPVGQRIFALRAKRAWHEVAAILSHYELWRRIAEGDDQFAAIFEDDILISEDLKTILDGDFPPDADMVKLETFLQVIYLDRKAVPMRSGRGSYRRLRTVHEGAGAYILSRRGAEKLVGAVVGFDQPIDTALFSTSLASREDLRVYQAIPAPAIQGMLVPEVKDTPAMVSDRVRDPEWASSLEGSSPNTNLLLRIAGRILNQAKGIRTTVPFAS